MAGVFGQVSASLETPREFGNVSNLSNLFASQGFGGNATNVIGASLSPFETSSVFGSGSNLNNLFASNAMGTTNFPNVSTQGSGFGYNATNAFGEASSWGHQLCLGVVAIRVIRLILMQWGLQISLMYLPNGTTSLPSQGIIFGGSTTNVLGSTSSSLGMSSLFGKGSNSNHMFAPSITGSTASPSFINQGSFIGGKSTGVFGVSSASSPSLTIGRQPTAFFGSSSTFGTTNVGNDGPFGSTTSRGAFGGIGNTSARACGPPAIVGFTSNNSSNAAAFMPLRNAPASHVTGSNFGQTSNALGIMPANPFSTSSFVATPSLPAGMPCYAGKSHEELRWENYGLKSGVTSFLGIPTPSCSAPAFPTNMNTPTFQIPSPNLSAFNTRTPIITGSGCDQVTAGDPNNQLLHNPQLSTQDLRLWPDYLRTTPKHLSIHSPSTGNGYDQVASSSAIRLTKPWPNNGNSVIHTIVPFFDQAAEGLNISKGYNYIIPRENPRSVIAASTEPTFDNASKKEASALNHAATVEYEDGTDNAKKAQISSSEPISHKDDFAKTNDSAKELELLLPKLQRSDYYTEPKIEKLASIERSNPGFCSHVKDFVVGRDGFGWVKFYGETSVRGLSLDSLVHFNYREVIVYDDESEKPSVGQGLNKAAEVTLLNVKYVDKIGKQHTSEKMVEKYIEKLKQAAEKQGAEFSPMI
uniref:Peptidase S59 domain-containing protein n=1 Tax=Chenopodium quinoa TaxID=63459 RepID=A0A803L9M0_CHEQI